MNRFCENSPALSLSFDRSLAGLLVYCRLLSSMANPDDPTIDQFDDIFHGYNDDLDEREDTNIDFDQFFTNFGKNDDDDDDDDDEKWVQSIDIKQINAMIFDEMKTNNINPPNEQRLSQQLSQLSTTTTMNEQKESRKRPVLTPTAPVDTTKKMKTGTVNPPSGDHQTMPAYLLPTNPIFANRMQPVLKTMAISIDIEDLRQIAFLKHKLALIDLNLLLWNTYRRSGTSTLRNDPQLQTITLDGRPTKRPYLSIWPEHVATKILADSALNHRHQLTTNEITYEMYYNYTNKILRQLQEQQTLYQSQLNERKLDLNQSFTLEMEDIINKLVEQQGIALSRLYLQKKIIVVEYNYNDRLIESEFYFEQPYQYQVIEKIFLFFWNSIVDYSLSHFILD